MSVKIHPLLAVLRACTPTERSLIAKHTGTNVTYLYHLAEGRHSPSVVKVSRIIEAVKRRRIHNPNIPPLEYTDFV
ncbi:MAG: hypothetical protein ACRDAJ_06920 [Serratia fonticola]